MSDNGANDGTAPGSDPSVVGTSKDAHVVAGDGGSAPQGDSAPKADNAPKVFDEATVKALRDEAAKHRTEKQAAKKELEDLQKRVKAFEDAQLSAEDKAKKELDELRNGFSTAEARAKTAELNFQVARAANAEKLVDIDAAVKLIDHDALEWSDGKITNMKEVLSDLKKAHPWLVAATQPQAPHTGTTNPPKQNGQRKVTRADLKSMSPEKILEHYHNGNIEL